MRAFLLAAALTFPLAAFGGDWHTATFPAKVSKLSVAKGYQLMDFAYLETGTARSLPDIRIPEKQVCAVTLKVGGSFGSMDPKPQTVFDEPSLCDLLKIGDRVELQYIGLATWFRFVAIKINGRWHPLPLMRQMTRPLAQACMDGAPDIDKTCDALVRTEGGTIPRNNPEWYLKRDARLKADAGSRP